MSKGLVIDHGEGAGSNETGGGRFYPYEKERKKKGGGGGVAMLKGGGVGTQVLGEF